MPTVEPGTVEAQQTLLEFSKYKSKEGMFKQDIVWESAKKVPS